MLKIFDPDAAKYISVPEGKCIEDFLKEEINRLEESGRAVQLQIIEVDKDGEHIEILEKRNTSRYLSPGVMWRLGKGW